MQTVTRTITEVALLQASAKTFYIDKIKATREWLEAGYACC